MKKEYKNLIWVQSIIVVFGFLSYLLLKSQYIYLMPKCTIKENLGILCPSCVGTRFAIELANFNLVKAFELHPIFFISVIYLGVMDIVYIINILFSKKIKIFKWWHLVVWLILLMIYTILRNLY